MSSVSNSEFYNRYLSGPNIVDKGLSSCRFTPKRLPVANSSPRGLEGRLIKAHGQHGYQVWEIYGHAGGYKELIYGPIGPFKSRDEAAGGLAVALAVLASTNACPMFDTDDLKPY